MYDRQVRRRRAVLALLVVVSLILLTAYFTESSGGPFHAIQRGVIQVFSPVQNGASRALKPARDLFGWFGDTFHAKKEVGQLKKQVATYRQEAVEGRAALAENAQLGGLASLDRSLAGYQPHTASIVSRSTENLLRDTVTVNKGSGDGVRDGDPVVAAEAGVNASGLVGVVTNVAGTTSIVTLLTDQSFSVQAEVLPKSAPNRRYFGIVRPSVGDPTDLLMQTLPSDAKISDGDFVVTAGSADNSRLTSLYPPNILIGTANKPNPVRISENQEIHLSPAVDVHGIDFVQILTSPNNGRELSADATAP